MNLRRVLDVYSKLRMVSIFWQDGVIICSAVLGKWAPIDNHIRQDTVFPAPNINMECKVIVNSDISLLNVISIIFVPYSRQ